MVFFSAFSNAFNAVFCPTFRAQTFQNPVNSFSSFSPVSFSFSLSFSLEPFRAFDRYIFSDGSFVDHSTFIQITELNGFDNCEVIGNIYEDADLLASEQSDKTELIK